MPNPPRPGVLSADCGPALSGALLGDVFKRFPDGVGPLLEYHHVLLRGASPLSIAQREMLAAYVSALNACPYCFGAHRTIAEVHGIEPDLLKRMISDPATYRTFGRRLGIVC